MTTRWPFTRYKIMFGVPPITSSRISRLCPDAAQIRLISESFEDDNNPRGEPFRRFELVQRH
jgi:hypothetical protein